MQSFPPVDRAGGAAWFSWEKKLSISPFRVWQEMYSREKRPQSLFRAASCAFCLDFILNVGLLNSGSLFFGIVCGTSVVHYSSLSVTNLVYCSSPRVSILLTVSATWGVHDVPCVND